MSAESRGSTIPASIHSTTSYKSCCEIRAKDPKSKTCGCGPDEPPKGELKRFENRYIQDRDIGRKNVWNFYNKDAVIGLGSISNIYRVTRKLKNESSSHIASSIFCGCFSSSKHIKQSVEENESSAAKKYFALKMIDTRLVNDEYLQEMRNEIDIFRSLNHPNILKAYETFHTKKNISIIMELCTGGDLYSRRPYSERQAAEIISSLLNALTYMHSNQIMHRDCKYHNKYLMSDDSCCSCCFSHDSKIRKCYV